MLCVILIVVFGMLELYLTNISSFTVLGLTYTWTRVVLLFLFIFGSFTDFLDGNIARKRNQVTTFGKFLDPIADKLLVNTITIFLVLYGNINVIVLVIFLIRDTLVDGLRFVAAQKNVVIAASKLGKAKTISQMVAIIVVLVLQATPLNWAISIGEILAYIAALISLVSGIDYIIKNAKVISPEDK
jgi:CDP-diacylglycerol--glycerol-3-phosphate 3-phosphatidyltransferase